MKVMKRISAVLLSLCLVVPCFSIVADAAGRISFADPTTAVGEYVEVKCAVRTEGETLGDINLELTYDESYLRFESSDSVEDNGDGTLSYTATGSSTEQIFYVEFQALQEGTTTIELASASVTDDADVEISMGQGYSTVTIGAGDPSKIEEDGMNEDETEEDGNLAGAADVEIDVNGILYTLTDEFADADIPNGYTRTQRTLDGEDRQMVENESGSVCLGYLRDADMVGDFFLYNEETATFSPYAEISISDSASIIVLSDTTQVSLPDSYSEAKLSLNEKEFPVWQDTENEGMYVFYAMNNSGEIGYYQYDSVEGTYQRFEPAVAEEEVEEADDTSSLIGKIQTFVEAHLAMMILVVGLGGIIGLILLIVLAVKLHHRNVELDEYYDKYGIDEEEAEETEEVETAENVEEEFEETDFEETDFEETEFEETEFEEVGFEEEFEETVVEDTFEEADFEEADFEEADLEEISLEDDFEDFRELEINDVEEEFTGYTERMDFTIDDLDELLGETKVQRHGHIEDDDTFKVDFIDLD